MDDATRIRALKSYAKHNQANAIYFIDYVVDRFLFRIKMIRTGNRRECHAQFDWHCDALRLKHVYIKPVRPNINGKVERSHLTDKQEFYPLLNYKENVDLEARLDQWEAFYTDHRYMACKGKYPLAAEISLWCQVKTPGSSR